MITTQELLNPYLLENANELELSDKINHLSSQYRNSEEFKDIAFNINLESELLIVYGEFIARLTEDTQNQKNNLENKIIKDAYDKRKEYAQDNYFERRNMPNFEYFKAQASDNHKLELDKLRHKEAMLIRFKRCYTSVENKQNALKKKLEAIKYDNE